VHEERFWQSLTEGAWVFRVLVIAIVIALLAFIALRIVMPMVNDRRTRRILLQGMSDDEASRGGADDNSPGSGDDSVAAQEAGSGAHTEAGTDPGSEANTEAGTDPGSEANTEAGTETESGTESETTKETETR
jgi:type II secretory pathway pseudopilin PulG